LALTLFEPFTQIDTDRSRPAGGLGLGLAIASRLAMLHEGSLVAESEGLDRGAVFTFKIPAAVGIEVNSVTAPGLAPHVRKSVLVVEDNPEVADSMAHLLELMGFDIRITHDGTTGIKMALDSRPDLIICDLGLPEPMNGFAFARACRADDTLQAVRLIAASGYSSQLDHSEARQAGFERLLVKPLTHESLTAILSE
jgi:CheY-like chemotaxis protein